MLRAECDFLARSVALDYRRTFPNAKLMPIEGARHVISLDQPETYACVMAAFPPDARLPIEDDDRDTAPC